MKRKHIIILLSGNRLSVYDAHYNPVTWVDIDTFKKKESLSASQTKKLNNLINGTDDEIILILPEIHY